MPTNYVGHPQNAIAAGMKGSRSPGKQHRFQKTSLLTENYVPQKFKRINEAPVTLIIPTLQPPSTEIETTRVFHGFGDKLRCECPKKTCQYAPLKVLVTEEHDFAQKQDKKREGSPIPSITMASGRDMYIETFRELLQNEYFECYRLYERYAQYEVKLGRVSSNDANVPDKVAKFQIAGIADARPSLIPGDLVFIRPHTLIPNPFHQGVPIHPASKTHAPPPFFTSNEAPYQNSQRAEIHATVVAVIRGKEANNRNKNSESTKDTVIVSWGVDQFLSRALFKPQKDGVVFTVRFVPSFTAQERALTAFRWLESVHPEVARDVLFPSESPVLPPPPAVDENDDDDILENEYDQLNENQAKFVQMVVTRTSHPSKEKIRPPMVLTGPAGTGKTKTLLVAILQALKALSSHGRVPHILVCTPSHTACDVITTRLTKLLNEQQEQTKNGKFMLNVRKDVFRLYDVSRGVETVPVSLLPYTRQNTDGQFILPATEELLSFKVIVTTCEDAHLLFMAGITNRTLRIRRQCFQSSVETKLSKLGLTGSVSGADQTHFDALFIDEAAQATEPESLIPLSVVVDDHAGSIKAEIALCGDPRQLSPNIYSATASENLQRSLLERLLRLPVATYGGGRNSLLGKPTATSWTTIDELLEYSFEEKDHTENLSVFLNLSYRGHPSFLLMPSKLFYFDKLRSAVRFSANSSRNDIWLAATRRLESLSPCAYPLSMSGKTGDWPMLFRGVKGKDTSMSIESFFGSNSWCNRMEANVVVEMIEQLVTQQGILTSSIGVMAAFRAQVVLIRRLLRERLLGAVNVGIVEDYQAVEQDVIIVSLTRSSKELIKADVERRTGLFHQQKRMNVALTRAENLLVVVGDPDTMAEDPSWKAWLAFCRDSGLWYGAKQTGQ